MHKNVIAAGAFAYGVLVGWALTADRYERKLKEREETHDETVAVLRARVSRIQQAHIEDNIKWSRAMSEVTAKLGPEKAPEGETEETPETSEDDEVDEAAIEEARSNLQGIIDQYTSNEEDRDEFVDSALRMEADNRPPFVISKADYAWSDEGDEYDKITLRYFPRHRILLDDDEDPINDVANTVGWRNLNRFGEESGDPDVVFIRSPRLRTDFEVERDEENELPLHVKYGMGREEFATRKAAGIIKLRPEDRD